MDPAETRNIWAWDTEFLVIPGRRILLEVAIGCYRSGRTFNSRVIPSVPIDELEQIIGNTSSSISEKYLFLHSEAHLRIRSPHGGGRSHRKDSKLALQTSLGASSFLLSWECRCSFVAIS